MDIVSSQFAEDLDKSTHSPIEYVTATARAKALDVYHRIVSQRGRNEGSVDCDLIISADTMSYVHSLSFTF